MRAGRKIRFALLLALILAVLRSNASPGGTARKQPVFLPVHVQPGLTRARGLLRNGTLPVMGAVVQGYFYTKLYLGTPPRPFAVIIDTGSTVTYVPCSSCGSQCGKHQSAAFDPASSSTFTSIDCTSGSCSCGSPSCKCRDDKCFYSRTYAEKSSSEGWLVSDVYSFPDNQPAVNISFGCETKETGEIYRQAADGILGMGNSDNALHSQLAAAGVIDNTFALCFGYPSGGGMFLGAVPEPYSEGMRYTPLVTTLPWHYYNVHVERLAVGGKALDLDPALFSRGYGSVMDSGTTFTYLPTQAFEAFAAAVQAAVEEHRLRRSPGVDPQFEDICWQGGPSSFEGLQDIFPSAELELGGGVVLALPPHRYLFMAAAGEFCLGVFDNGDRGTLVGSITVRNMLVQYDRQHGRVGFAEVDCHALGSSAQSSFVASSLHLSAGGGGGGGAGANSVDIAMQVAAGGEPAQRAQWQRETLLLLAGAVAAAVLLEVVYSYRDSISGRLADLVRLRAAGKPSDDEEAVALVSLAAEQRSASTSPSSPGTSQLQVRLASPMPRVPSTGPASPSNSNVTSSGSSSSLKQAGGSSGSVLRVGAGSGNNSSP